MAMSDRDIEFVKANSSGAMITMAKDGTPRIARCGVAVVDGKIWSSGTTDRVRTKRLRRDPRCTLYVHDTAFSWVALESTVTILDGPDSPALSVKLFRQTQGKPTGPLSWFDGDLEEEAFLEKMREDGRLIYEFDVHRSYGLH